jgi:hypothetical protein
MGNLNPSPFSRLASATVSGLVSVAAQTFAGVKTFAALIIASAGVQVASLFNTNGTGSTDVGVKVGVSTADASVNATAKLLSARTGIGGTEVEKFWVDKAGMIRNAAAGGYAGNAAGTNRFFSLDDTSFFRFYDNGHQFTFSGNGVTHIGNGAVQKWGLSNEGLESRNGTDSSGTPGAATINKPSGISAIAGGATSVVITNSLATTTCRPMITWLGDLGAQSKVPWVTRAAGSFTVNVGTAPAGAVAFSWELNILV